MDVSVANILYSSQNYLADLVEIPLMYYTKRCR